MAIIYYIIGLFGTAEPLRSLHGPIKTSTLAEDSKAKLSDVGHSKAEPTIAAFPPRKILNFLVCQSLASGHGQVNDETDI